MGAESNDLPKNDTCNAESKSGQCHVAGEAAAERRTHGVVGAPADTTEPQHKPGVAATVIKKRGTTEKKAGAVSTEQLDAKGVWEQLPDSYQNIEGTKFAGKRDE